MFAAYLPACMLLTCPLTLVHATSGQIPLSSLTHTHTHTQLFSSNIGANLIVQFAVLQRIADHVSRRCLAGGVCK